MALMLPDSTLDTLICDYCKKYLSVKPIKIYANNDVKCGRCSKPDDEGFVSFYETLAEQILFKCINRFDGCSKLLSYLEVQNHEKECKGQVLNCPICLESNTCPTYMLRTHFKQCHPQNYLYNNWFYVNLDKSLSKITKCFLYHTEDHLFFIYFQYDYHESTLALNAVYIGEPHRSKQISQTFVIRCRSEDNICTKNLPCPSYYTKTNYRQYAFEIQIKNMNLDTNFIVEFNLNVVNAAKPILLPCLQTFTSSLKKFSLKRGSNPEYQVTVSGIALLKLQETKKIVIFPQCNNCGYIELSNYYNKGTYIVEHDVRHYVCFFCRHYYKEVKTEKVEDLLPIDVYKTLDFHCKWNCKYTHKLPYIAMHEEICVNQVTRVCPVKTCMFFGKLFEIRKHFKKSHRFSSLQILEPLLVINRFSPSLKQCYVLVSDKFVWTQYFWKDSIFHMNISICEDEDTIKPVARIFDLNDTYFGCFEDHSFSLEYKLKLVIKLELKTFKK